MLAAREIVLRGALAEFERSLIRERTQAGLAARRAGRTGSGPLKLTDDDAGLLRQTAESFHRP
jgi:DNA invertase Pin-like site-specific DNA recombinase